MILGDILDFSATQTNLEFPIEERDRSLTAAIKTIKKQIEEILFEKRIVFLLYLG